MATEDVYERMARVRAAKALKHAAPQYEDDVTKEDAGKRKKDLHERIERALEQNQGPMTVHELHEVLGRSREGIRKQLHWMIEERKVKRVVDRSDPRAPQQFELRRRRPRIRKPSSPLRSDATQARRVAHHVAAGHVVNRIMANTSGARFRRLMDELGELNNARKEIEREYEAKIAGIEDKQRAVLQKLAADAVPQMGLSEIPALPQEERDERDDERDEDPQDDDREPEEDGQQEPQDEYEAAAGSYN